MDNQRTRSRQMRGLTLVEVLVVLAVCIVLIGLLLPATRSAREASRRMGCSNNLKQLGSGLINYHSTFERFPKAMGGTNGSPNELGGNQNRLSGLVAIIPFLESSTLWEKISNPMKVNGVEYPAMGPAVWNKKYPPWKKQIATYLCPSYVDAPSDFGRTSYTFCIGDVVRDLHQPKVQRGVFACCMFTCFDDIVDGASNTIAMAEIGHSQDFRFGASYAPRETKLIYENPNECFAVVGATQTNVYAQEKCFGRRARGSRWGDGAAGYSLVNTILPPNAPSCAIEGTEAVDGVYSAASSHQGGAHVLMADGAVRFITDNVDVGESSVAPPILEEGQKVGSPYGVWGALGSANGGEKQGH